MTESDIKRFWDKIEKTETCWNWIASKRLHGYGQISMNGKPRAAHRVSWEIHYGKIGKGQAICHKCDNPSCVRPDHLFTGTQGDNLNDCRKKNRINHVKGIRSPHAKLNDNKVTEIRELFQNPLNCVELAKRYCVSKQTILDVVNGIVWKHLPLSNRPRRRRYENEKMAHYKLTPAQIREIRKQYADETSTRCQIALKYNISKEHVSQITTRKMWKYIE